MYRGGIIIKTPEQIEQMAAAGAIQARCLKMLRSKVRAGVTTDELDLAAERFIASQGATPSFLGYRGFPGSICASPNSMVVHGIPGPYELRRGDIISLDVGVTHEGWVADAAITVAVGEITPEARAAARDHQGLAVRRGRAGPARQPPRRRLARRPDGASRPTDLSIIRSLVGHGIGRDMHEDPQVPNYGEPGRGPELEPGMVLAIEPMVNAGGPEVRLGDDNWAVYSADGSLAAHFEFTVAVTEDGPADPHPLAPAVARAPACPSVVAIFLRRPSGRLRARRPISWGARAFSRNC